MLAHTEVLHAPKRVPATAAALAPPHGASRRVSQQHAPRRPRENSAPLLFAAGGTNGGGGTNGSTSRAYARHTPEFVCSALSEFVEAEGRLSRRPDVWQHGGQQVSLGIWLHNRRMEQKRGQLDRQLQRDIEAAVGPALLAGLWEPIRQRLPFSVMCEALAAFRAAEGRLPTQLEEWEHEGQQVPLGMWLQNRRSDQKRGRLASAPQRQLEIEAAVGPALTARLWDSWAAGGAGASSLCNS